MPILFMSGYTREEPIIGEAVFVKEQFLQKSFTASQLFEKVRAAFVAKVAESLQYEVVRAKDGLDALLAYSDAPGIDLAKPFSPQQQGSGLLVLFMSGA